MNLAAGPVWNAGGERSERGATQWLCAYLHTPDDAATTPSLPGRGLSFFEW